MNSLFDLAGRVAIITGGAGLLGQEHARAIASAGGIPVIVDIRYREAGELARSISKQYGVPCYAFDHDATTHTSMSANLYDVISATGRVDILVNNLSCNPQPFGDGGSTRPEMYPIGSWERDINLGLTSTLICTRIFGGHMARHTGGVIVNIASDLSVIAPDQRLYQQADKDDGEQPVKAVSYSAVKHGVIGLTKYFAAYWAKNNVRVNALSPGGIFNDQPVEFVQRVSQLIPMGRMANRDEMRGALIFLCSDASSYMTGQNLIVDGGRTII